MSKRYQGGILGVGFNPLQAPNAPTSVAATGGDTSASVSFTAPSNVGGSPIPGYTVGINLGGIGATGSASPITVSGLTNDTAYTFNVWALNTYGPSPAGGPSGSVTPSAARGLFGGSQDTFANRIEYVTIATTGNATTFGQLSSSQDQDTGACSSSTRGVWAAGYSTSAITYVTIATTGNSVFFGNLTLDRRYSAGASNSTRGLFAGGFAESLGSRVNVIDYITIASTGNATDFGDMAFNAMMWSAMASSTRIVYGGADNESLAMYYVTIATTGGTTSFGNLTTNCAYAHNGCSSSTRGVIGGGNGTNYITTMQYVTIATTGNSAFFGNLTVGRWGLSATSSATRGLFAGGRVSGGVPTNVIDYITIATTGNATDFGDLTVAKSWSSACSSAHGGLA